jgi:hypothetical protein
VTGADRSANVYLRLVHQPHQRNAYVRIIRLLRRLLQGQERNDYLFAVIDTLTDVFVHRALSADACADAERLTVLRMLHALGYVAPAEPFADVLHTDALTPAMLDIARAKRRSIVREINRALRESHL